jgi:dynein intermediate chain 1
MYDVECLFFSVKDQDESKERNSVETNEIVTEDENTEKEKTEADYEGKEDENEIAKEGEDKRGGGDIEGEEEAEVVSEVTAKKAPGTSAHFTKAGAKKLTNQFNFCERAALTYNNPFRVSFVTSNGYV